jgi:endo-1,4-beta-xylanase
VGALGGRSLNPGTRLRHPPMNETLESLVRRMENPDPVAEARIQEGIRTHRMATGALRVLRPDGTPLASTPVRLTQTRHAFEFGCNAFLLDDLGSPEQEAVFTERFRSVFNLTPIGFYWSEIEPERGKHRFSPDSPHRRRRPPIDRVLDWCDANGITPKAHPLVWHRFVPDWFPRDPGAARAAIRERIELLAARYAGRIRSWDVVNEAVIVPADSPLPPDYAAFAFQVAAECFPADCELVYNEYIWAVWSQFQREYSQLHLLIENLLLRGCRLDALGLQFHAWVSPERAAGRDSNFFDPAFLFSRLDHCAAFGRPLHISEISIPAWASEPLGETFQAAALRLLYRTWFSHPSVHSIVYWNLPDGGAETADENAQQLGLTRADFSPKPAWTALHDLVNLEWHTETEAVTDADGVLRFTGFRGDYRITVPGAATDRRLDASGVLPDWRLE